MTNTVSQIGNLPSRNFVLNLELASDLRPLFDDSRAAKLAKASLTLLRFIISKILLNETKTPPNNFAKKASDRK